MSTNPYTEPNIEDLIEENKRLRSVETYLRVINEFAVDISSLNTIKKILWTAAKHVIGQLDFVDCVIYLYDDVEEVLVQVAAFGDKSPEGYEILNWVSSRLGEGSTFEINLPLTPPA